MTHLSVFETRSLVDTPRAKGAPHARRWQYASLGLILCVAGCGKAADVPSTAASSGPSGTAILASTSTPPGGYAIGENTATANAGPVRLSRVSYLSGPVTWRPNSTTQWSTAGMNLPCRQGAEVWVKGGSRAEMQFDDGSTMRLGGGAVATLQAMYSDDKGEFTEVKLNGGLCTFHLRNKLSEYQIDTPLSSIKATGPADIRVGVGTSVEVACTGGTADVSGKQGDAVLHPQERLEVQNTDDPYQVTSMPAPDPWDQFNNNRDVIYSHHNEHVPPNIDLVSGDLDSYGSWHDDPEHGYVWAPREREVGWRPYHHGHWVWVSPWGWTWVGNEDWGYAPYHYGTWIHEGYGWAWSPGPAVQYWSPAVVDYVDNGSYISWAPLAPGEVVYPAAIDIGFHSGNWWLNFSIGGAAAYYPSGPEFCEGRPWSNVYANRDVDGYGVSNITNIYNESGPGSNAVFARNSRFIPQNGSRFAGMTTSTRAGFAGNGAFESHPADPRGTVFRSGRSFTAAPSKTQVFGPPTLRPGPASFTTSRTFAQAGAPPRALQERSVVRRGVPTVIASNSGTIRASSTTSGRQAAVVRASNMNRSQPATRESLRPTQGHSPMQNNVQRTQTARDLRSGHQSQAANVSRRPAAPTRRAPPRAAQPTNWHVNERTAPARNAPQRSAAPRQQSSARPAGKPGGTAAGGHDSPDKRRGG